MKTKKDSFKFGMYVVYIPTNQEIDYNNLNRGTVHYFSPDETITVKFPECSRTCEPQFVHTVYIVAAAMLMKDGDVLVGIRHFSPEMRKTAEKAYGPEYYKQVETQGFVDQWGKFFNRENAWKIAEANGQIRFEVSAPGTLYSENIY